MARFKAESAFKQALSIAYPRLVGTQGEQQAANYIRQQLEGFGYGVSEEGFYIGHTPWGFSRLCLMLGLTMLLLSWLTYWLWPRAAFCLLLGLLFLEHFSTKGWLMLSRRTIRDPKISDFGVKTEKGRLRSKNIIASLHPSSNKPKSTLYIMAHYDSKSQTISLPMRIFWLTLALVAISVLLVGLGFRLGGSSLDVKPRLWFVIAALAVLRLLIVSTQNRSSGGLDNAGSVGVALELARIFSQHPPPEINISYLFTGAEEWGLLGASHYATRHAGEWSAEQTYFVNLDGVGIGGRLVILGQNAPVLAKKLVRMAQQQGTRLRRLGLLPGLLVDHIPIAKAGFPTLTLACIAAKSLLIHTHYDTISLVDKTGLGEVGKLLEAWIWRLAER